MQGNNNNSNSNNATTKQPISSSIDNLLLDVDRTIKKQKICKRNITQNLNNVSELIQNTINDLNNHNNVNINTNTMTNNLNNASTLIFNNTNSNSNSIFSNSNNIFYNDMNSNFMMNNGNSNSINSISNIHRANSLDLTEKMEEENDNYELKDKLQSLYTGSMNVKALQNILNNNKEYFAYISKLGKDIDKVFNKEIDNVFPDIKLDHDLILKSIYEHYLRDGKIEFEETMKKEFGNGISTTIDEKMRKSFLELNIIVKEIEKKNLDPAIKWATEHEKELEAIDSHLLFNLHSLKFATIVQENGVVKATEYAQQNLDRFMLKYMKDIEKLMGSIIDPNRSKNSRYLDIYDKNKWEMVSYSFITDCCKIQKTTPESALYLVLTAGNLSLPTFFKYFNLAKNNVGDKLDLKHKPEIPVPIDLGKDFQFHSIFVCPVTKEVITPDNPAMMLKCGHVISDYALKKMLTSTRIKFKCPYCPIEQNATAAKPLFFN